MHIILRTNFSTFFNSFAVIFSDDSCDNFATRFGHNTGYSLNDVLWTCSNMFSKRLGSF